jgi:hypothetical protein
VLEDKRRYQAWMRSRRSEIEAGHTLTADIFSSSSGSGGSGEGGHSGTDSSRAGGGKR